MECTIWLESWCQKSGWNCLHQLPILWVFLAWISINRINLNVTPSGSNEPTTGRGKVIQPQLGRQSAHASADAFRQGVLRASQEPDSPFLPLTGPRVWAQQQWLRRGPLTSAPTPSSVFKISESLYETEKTGKSDFLFTEADRILQPPWIMPPTENAVQAAHWWGQQAQTKNAFHRAKEIAQSVKSQPCEPQVPGSMP